jgi:hypothetical protein
MGRSVRWTLLLLILALAPLRAGAAGEEVQIGYERTLGAALALGGLGLPLATQCPDEGWSAAPPERPPAHRAAHPYVLRVEPRICIDGQRLDRLPPSSR